MNVFDAIKAVKKIKDDPVGFEPKIETKKIITWKNSITPKALLEEVIRYGKSNNENDKIILGKRIRQYIDNIMEDLRADQRNPKIEYGDLKKHYEQYNKPIQEARKLKITTIQKII